MPKVEIDVDQILTCAVHLEAEPGDQLLVMHGVVVAMIEGRKRVPIPTPTVARAPQPPSLALPALNTTTMMDVLREHGAMTTRQIAAHLTKTHNYHFNEAERNKIGAIMRELLARHMVKKTTESRFPAYSLH